MYEPITTLGRAPADIPAPFLTSTDSPPGFDAASLRCVDALKVRPIDSSRDLGWCSALVDHHQILSREEAFETSPTPDHTLVVMTQGEQAIESCRRGEWRSSCYRPGTVGITPGGGGDVIRRRVKRDGGPACKVNIYIPQLIYAETADHLGLSHADLQASLCRPSFVDPTLHHLALGLVQAIRAGAPDLYAQTAIRWMCVHLLTSSHQSLTSRPVETISDKRLQRAIDLITDRFGESLSVDSMAAEAGVSKFHFARLFQQATGRPPHTFLLDVRFEAAKTMLESTGLSVAEVARRCGFAGANHFATQFAKRYRVSPSDFRLGTVSQR